MTHPSDDRTLPPSTADVVATLPPSLDPDATLAPSSISSIALTDTDSRAPAGYAIEKELGRGGMGVVYLARDTRLNRRCALKMILSGAHSGSDEIERFRTEAQAIARLQHPGIVQVFEIGEHDGKPFMALEFCGGGSLDAVLAQNPLAPVAAAELVQSLAEAMHAAHSANVIHRDLKPANVLLTVDRQPKVTDFGLAKKLDEDGATRTGSVMGTPSYMPPEQADGRKDIGPAADIYSLGAILYECLAGRPPFRAATALDTILQVVTEEPVPLRQLNAKVPADLETIAHKCLQKDPKKRYASAVDLADDLTRFLAGEPVKARPVGAAERGLRWVKRNPVVSALLAAVLLVLAAGVVASWLLTAWALREKEAMSLARADERKARDQAFAALRSMTDVFDKRIAQNVALDDSDREFLRGIIAQFDAFATIQGDDADSRAVRAEGRARVGLMRTRLGQSREAEADYEAALAIRKQLVADFPGRPEFRQDLAQSHNTRGVLQRDKGQLKEAEADYTAALAIQKQLVTDFPSHPDYRRELAGSHNNQGFLRSDAGRPKEAEADFDEALRLQKQLVTDFPENPDCRHDLATSHLNRGNLLRSTGQLKKAETSFDAALALQKQLAVDFPTRLEFRQKLALSHHNLGNLLIDTNNLKDAEANHEAALQIYKQLAADFPTRPEFRQDLARSFTNRGALMQTTGRLEEAAASLDAALTIQKPLAADFPNRPEFREMLAASHHNRGMLLRATGKPKEAEADYDAALVLRKRLAVESPTRPEYRRDLAQSYNNRGNLMLAAGRLQEAEKDHGEVLTLRKQLAAEFPAQPDLQNDAAGTSVNLAILRQHLGDLIGARKLLQEGLPHHRAALDAQPRNPAYRQSYRNHLYVLTQVQAGSLERDDAFRTAEVRRDLGWNPPDDACDAAGFLALCIPILTKHRELDEKQRQEAVRFYGDAALQNLRDAIAKGWKDSARLKSDTAFAPLRANADFQKLLADLEARP